MLFCPFCREAFDDAERCPHHDVALVSLRELGQLSAANVPDDERLPMGSLRLGRGALLLGAAGTLLGFFCPFGQLVGDVSISNTLLTLARGRAVRLWVVPVAALALLSMLHRRRTPAAMRGARLGALFVACLPSIVVAVTWYGAAKAAGAMAGEVTFQLGLGSWLVFVSGVLAIAGSARLGVRRAQRVR
jgi:fumarate reductase subunit D